MAAPRAQTLQSKFGFQDLDLLNHTHDEIILWVDANIEKIIQELVPNPEWSLDQNQALSFVQDNTKVHIEKLKDEIDKRKEKIIDPSYRGYWTKKDLEEIVPRYELWLQWEGLGNPPIKPPLKISDVKWEAPILGSNHFTIGFIDILAKYTWTELDVIQTNSKYGKIESVSLDERCFPKWRLLEISNLIAFEIKIVIPSLGELVRQVRMYQTYLPRDTKFVVVSPDDKFASALKSQGIDFYKYNP